MKSEMAIVRSPRVITALYRRLGAEPAEYVPWNVVRKWAPARRAAALALQAGARERACTISTP